MEWIRAHPYAASIVGAFVLILIGVFIVQERAPVQPDAATTRVWSGIGGNFFDPLAGALSSEKKPETIYSNVQSGPPFYYDPSPAQSSTGGLGDGFDFDAFIEMLSGVHETQVGMSEDNTLFEAAYSFIPGGLISTSTSQKSRTPTQQALYNYGNEAGSFVQSFESLFPNASQILKDQFEDREDAGKRASLLSLAQGLAGVGDSLERMEGVPQEIKNAHSKVAASYKELGEKLSHIPDARRDEDLVAVVLTYNTSADTYVKNYVALATLLSAYGVTFGPEDPGSIFTFTQTSL